MRKILLLVSLLACLVACGPKKARKEAAAPATRPFPLVEIPAMLTGPDERFEYAALHYWEGFLKESFPADTLQINGVPQEEMSQQMGLFASLLQQVSPAVGEQAMVALYNQLAAFQKKHPEGKVLSDMTKLTTRYFYDPTSPLRSEELYLPFVSRLATSDLIDPAWRMGYEWDAKMCSLNRLGTPAADFVFIDTQGARRTLHGVKAEYTLLIFGNPDCTACKQLMEDMTADPAIQILAGEGRLKVVDIYIDEDIDLWKQRMADYPADWINGYDPSFTIRNDVLYSVRALPSLYLLDRDKKVLAKDAEPDKVLDMLAGLA